MEREREEEEEDAYPQRIKSSKKEPSTESVMKHI